MTDIIKRISEFFKGHETKPLSEVAHEDKLARSHLSQQQIDKTLADSFPASDPPSWY